MNDTASTIPEPENESGTAGANPAATSGATEAPTQPIQKEMPPLALTETVDRVEVSTNGITQLKEEHWYPVSIPPNTRYSIILIQPRVEHPADQVVARPFKEKFVVTTGTPLSAGGPPFGSSVAHGRPLATGALDESYWFRVAERNGDAITLGPYIFGVQKIT